MPAKQLSESRDQIQSSLKTDLVAQKHQDSLSIRHGDVQKVLKQKAWGYGKGKKRESPMNTMSHPSMQCQWGLGIGHAQDSETRVQNGRMFAL